MKLEKQLKEITESITSGKVTSIGARKKAAINRKKQESAAKKRRASLHPRGLQYCT